MSSQQLDEEAIFDVARQIPERGVRGSYLDQVCAGDQALRERVEALLQVHEQEQEFLRSEPASTAAGATPITELAGEQIGRYKLLQQLGEGGMGTVFMAEQTRPVSRRVALKIIKPGMDSKAVVARFEAERQALAMMDHPNVAKVLDAGMTETQRPYFVMELVKGVPVTDYCDENKLTIRQRLELFIEVCKAVQHAHQKGIIHRDLKPSNVLVALYDGRPVPKIIDFGVAKAINQRLTERTMFTQYGQIVGTLEYMSPEQAQFNQLDVDTRTDIYSLGVLLYELLTGATPFDRQRLRSSALEEVLRILREEDPPKPSTRISTLGEAEIVVSSKRATGQKRLSNLLRGDLDWIAMKALEKDRGRRYESATDFAADIERFLTDSPIVARPPSTTYRFRKLVTRNKGWFCSAVVVVVTLLFGLISTSAAWKSALDKQSQLSLALAERDATLSRLRDEVSGRALNEALSGEFEQAMSAIDDAEIASVDESLVLAIRGLAHLYAGDAAEAMRQLEQAIAISDDSIPARSGLWLACLHNGQYGRMSEIRRSIDHRVPSTDTERLFFAQMTRHSDPQGTVSVLDSLLAEHRHWGAVYSLRGRARIQLAKDAYLEDEALSKFAEAISDYEKAAILTPASEFVLSDFLQALLEACEFGKHRVPPVDVQAWRTRATEIAASLGPPSRMGGYPFNARTTYLASMGQEPELQRIWEAMYHDESAPLWATAARLFADNRMADLNVLLHRDAFVAEPSHDVVRMLYLAEISKDRSSAVNRIYDQSFRMRPYASDLDLIALDAFLLLGELSRTREEASRLLGLKSYMSGRWNDRVLTYIANPCEDSEGQLKRLAGPFSRERVFAYYAIGMVALARGDREKAKSCFDEVLKTGKLDYWCYDWAFAFRNRLGNNPAWPHWIDANQ